MEPSHSASASASASEEPSATASEAAPSASASEIPECDETDDLVTRDFDDEEEMWVYEDEVPEGWVLAE